MKNEAENTFLEAQYTKPQELRELVVYELTNAKELSDQDISW